MQINLLAALLCATGSILNLLDDRYFEAMALASLSVLNALIYAVKDNE